MTRGEIDAAHRAAARRNWNGRLTDLAGADDDGFVEDEALRASMMWPLMRDAWVMTGADLPEYARADMPGAVWRAGEQPPEHAA
jgi:hypothetical protein